MAAAIRYWFISLGYLGFLVILISFLLGSHRAYDYDTITNNGFQVENSQIDSIYWQVFSFHHFNSKTQSLSKSYNWGAEAITIDVSFIGNFSSDSEVTSNNFRSCVSAYPICGSALYNYCNAGYNKVSQRPNFNLEQKAYRFIPEFDIQDLPFESQEQLGPM